MSQLSRTLALAAALVATLSVAQAAEAADKGPEAAAREALKRGADDYLATDYATGVARLTRALNVCGTNGCTRRTTAALLSDLGTMQFRAGDRGASQHSWAAARKLDPQAVLNPDFETPDLRAAWDGDEGSGEDAGAQPTDGDFAHTPAREQRVDTPLPVYAEVVGGSPLARVVLKYRSAGVDGQAWSRMELNRMGKGWAGLIPCADVTRGTLRYWLQGFDENGEPVASSGDPKHPFTVPIRDTLSGEAPHLPGKPAPRTCGERSDCPDGDCEDSPSTASPLAVAAHETNAGGGAYARFWIGVSAELPEFVDLPGGSALCKLTAAAAPANSSGYYCTNPDGTDFPSRASATQNANLQDPSAAGNVAAGVRPGDVRVMGLFDYALSPALLVGARLGYVLNSYPGEAAVKGGRAFGSKLHVEARVTYLFGNEPLRHVGFAPMAFAGLGLAEFDGHATSAVALANVAGQQPVNVWLTDGPFFAVLGGGYRYELSLRSAFTIAARVNVAIGGNGLLLTYGPEFGFQYGF